ncbi:hypothetical protein ACOHYD_13360 [Desulfobacterota bacterium M19]
MNNRANKILKSFFDRRLGISHSDLPDRLGPIDLFTSSIDMRINIFNITSIALLIGLFVNFISSVSMYFPKGKHDIIYPIIYLLSCVINILLFAIIIKKYIVFANSWISMRTNYKNNDIGIINILNESEELIKSHCYDFTRYLLLIIFVLILFNISLPIRSITNIIIFQPMLCFPSIIIYILIILLIEWPSISLHIFYINFIEQKIDSKEDMTFD